MSELEPEVEAVLRRAKRRILDAHSENPNVTGAGVGFRFRAGRLTEEPVVIVMVAAKQPETLVPPAHLLPKTVEVDGTFWGVDVVQAGPFKLHTPIPTAQTGKSPLDNGRSASQHQRGSALAFRRLPPWVSRLFDGTLLPTPGDNDPAGDLTRPDSHRRASADR